MAGPESCLVPFLETAGTPALPPPQHLLTAWQCPHALIMCLPQCAESLRNSSLGSSWRAEAECANVLCHARVPDTVLWACSVMKESKDEVAVPRRTHSRSIDRKISFWSSIPTQVFRRALHPVIVQRPPCFLATGVI